MGYLELDTAEHGCVKNKGIRMNTEQLKDLRAELMNSPLWQENTRLASMEENSFVWGEVNKSRPNDYIRLKKPEMIKMDSLWTRFLPSDATPADEFYIPSDLLLAGTIPLTDVVLDLEFDGDGKMYRFRVVIFENYREIIQAFFDSDSNETVMVGLCIRQFTEPGLGNEVGFPITVAKDLNYINNVETMYYRGVPNGFHQETIPKMLAYILQSGAMSVWYGIQLALLNPVTKEAFIKAGKEKYKDSISIGNAAVYRKGPTRYIRRLNLHQENFDRLLQGTGKSYERHTLAWRVIGHWRHYKNGQTIFIKPYWKGVMKDIQKQDYRERKVIVPEKVAPMVRVQQ